MASLARNRTRPACFIQMVDTNGPSTPSKDKNRRILQSYHEIPEWYQDNDNILHGYRPESNSACACFASWLYVHNETVNIYSHLLPAVLSLIAEGLIYHYFRARYPEATIGDRLIFAFFLLTAATCLDLSAIYHTMMNHSIHVSNLWLRFDFVGIVVLTLGDFTSGIYMVFYCEPTLQKIYWTMVQTASFIDTTSANRSLIRYSRLAPQQFSS
jgi:adiponectin receptor